jgi:hypothetical protein
MDCCRYPAGVQESVKQIAAILTVLLTGIAVEVVLAFVKDEPLNLARLATLGGIVAAMLGVLTLTRQRAVSLRTVVAGGLFVTGFAMAVLGVVALASDAGFTNTTVANVIGMTMTSAGVVVVLSGVYVAIERRPVAAPVVDEYLPATPVATKPLHRGDPAGTVTTYAGFTVHTERIVDLCASALSPDDLHFVGYYIDGMCRFTVDVLNDRALDSFYDEVGRDVRRHVYEEHGRFIHDQVVKFDRQFDTIDAGTLIRVVLDVEKGAFYYFVLEKNRFLVGVTMNQERVHEADEKMVRLIDKVRVSLGHRPLSDLNRPVTAIVPLHVRQKNGPAA